MSKAKNEKERMADLMRKWGTTYDGRGNVIRLVDNPAEWRELAFAPIPKGMLALAPRHPKKGIVAADVPDCSIPLPSVKAELLRFMDEADIRTPEAAARWRAVFMAAHLDECLLEGITDQLARRCTIRAILHLLRNFSTFVKASEGKMSPEEVLEKLGGIEGQLAEIKEPLQRRTTPPVELAWWRNLQSKYEDQPKGTEAEKWLAVAKTVVMGALNEQKKPLRDRHSDYLTPRMLNHLVDELKTGSRTEIENTWAKKLSRYVRREKQRAAKPS